MVDRVKLYTQLCKLGCKVVMHMLQICLGEVPACDTCLIGNHYQAESLFLQRA